MLFTRETIKPFEIGLYESLFSLSNGYIGTRTLFEEGVAKNLCDKSDLYINSFYELHKLEYGEKFHGYPDYSQRMVTINNILKFNIYINDKKIEISTNELELTKLNLNLNNGILERETIYKFENSESLTVKVIKFISLSKREFLGQKIIINNNFLKSKKIRIEFPIFNTKENIKLNDNTNDPRMINKKNKLDLVDKIINENKAYAKFKTKISNKTIALGYLVESNILSYKSNYNNIEISGEILNEEIVIKKYNIIYDDKFQNTDFHSFNTCLIETLNIGFDGILIEQKRQYKEFWDTTGIFIENFPNIADQYNFNMFHLFQNASRESWTNIPAKGLTGMGYEGHYFWDSEIYLFPAILSFDSELAKNLILFRYNTLKSAKDRAKIMGHSNGALFPWRTINGEESSAYYPAGTAQYHINADIAYAVILYYQATGDKGFLVKYGMEILIEINRIWMDKTSFHNGKYHINSVTGPDEYQLLVDDDYYTNSMVQFTLLQSIKLYDDLSIENKKMLKRNLLFEKSELSNWKNTALNLELLYDINLDIDVQHKSFLQKKKIKIANIEQMKPLLLNVHPLKINDWQITKQPDVVLSNLLLFNINFKNKMINNFKYYKKTDTSDSSLSISIYSIMKARLRIGDFGINDFEETVSLDIKNRKTNTNYGLHLANIAGTRLFLIKGILGIDYRDDGISIDPILNNVIGNYKIKFKYKSDIITFENIDSCLNISKNTQNIINIYYKDKKIILSDEIIVKGE